MDRCALFVDAGYALADGAMAVHGTRRRDSVSWDHAGLLKLLAGLARDRTGLPVLRCYWYETAAEGRRTAEHDALAEMPGLKLRLVNALPGRREGIESQLRRDLITLAKSGAISDAFIASANEHIAEIVAEVQDLGLRVVVLHIASDGGWTIPLPLRQECDDIVEISGVHLRSFVDLIRGAEPASGDDHFPAGAFGPHSQVDSKNSMVGALTHRGLPAAALPAPGAIYQVPDGGDYRHDGPSYAAAGQGGGQQDAHGSYGESQAGSVVQAVAQHYVGATQHSDAAQGRPAPQGGSSASAAPVQSGVEQSPVGLPSQMTSAAGPASSGPAHSALPPYPAQGYGGSASQSAEAQNGYQGSGQHSATTNGTVPGGPDQQAAAAQADGVARNGSPASGGYPSAGQPSDGQAGAGQATGYQGQASYQVGATGTYQNGVSGSYQNSAQQNGAQQHGGDQTGMPQNGSPQNGSRPNGSGQNGYQIVAQGHQAGQHQPSGQNGQGIDQPGQGNGQNGAAQFGYQPGQPGQNGSHHAGQNGSYPSGPNLIGQNLTGQNLTGQNGSQQPGQGNGQVRGSHLPSGFAPGQVQPGQAQAGQAQPSHPQSGPGQPGPGQPGPGQPGPMQPDPRSRDPYWQGMPAASLAGGFDAAPVQVPAQPGFGPPDLSFANGQPGGGSQAQYQLPQQPGVSQHAGAPQQAGGPPMQSGAPMQAARSQQPVQVALPDAVKAAHSEGFTFGESVGRDAPGLWLEAVLARKPRMPSDLEARLLQGSVLPIDSLLHDEVRHSLRRGFWDALESARR